MFQGFFWGEGHNIYRYTFQTNNFMPDQSIIISITSHSLETEIY